MLSKRQTTIKNAAGLAILAVSTVPFPAFSAMANNWEPKTTVEKETTIHINQNVVVVSGRLSLGQISGQSQELVYVPEIKHTLSRLTWDLKEVYMLGIGGSVAPTPWLRLNADAWFKLNDGDGSMNDFDWVVQDFQYTHWSHHENLDLTKGTMFDVNGEVKFYEFEDTKFWGIAGFKHDNWEWKAYGGYYVYSSYWLYDTVGEFDDNELGITYEQNFYAPYLGLGFTSALSSAPINFSGRVIGSTFVYGDDKDQHHMRHLVFEEEFDSGMMFGLDLGGSYHFTENIALAASYHYQDYQEMKGETTITDTTTGEVTKLTGDVAGMDHRSSLFSLSAIYSF